MSKHADPISGRDLMDAAVSSGNEARAEVIRLKKEVFAVSCELNASIQHVELLKTRQACFDELLAAAEEVEAGPFRSNRDWDRFSAAIIKVKAAK